MEQIKYGARLKFWAWLFVAFFMLLISKIGYAQTITNGLNYQTYAPSGSWASPDRNTLTPLTSGVIANLYTDWDIVLDSGRNSGVVVKFTGFFKATETKTYTFGLEGDDGVELIIDGQTLISHWADQGSILRTATMNLTAGQVVPITIWYYENGGGARLRFTQQVAGGGYTAIPTTMLATSDALWVTPSCNPCSPNTNNANLGFESGTTQNWTISNGTGTAKTTPWSPDGSGVQTSTGMTNYSPGGGKTWTVTPYGTYMMVIQAGGDSPNFDPAMSSLGLTTTQVTEIKNYLTGLGGNSNPTNASWSKRTVTLESGKTYVVAWQYISTDYVPFNDGSMMTLVHSTDPSKVPTLNNNVKNYALLGFTNPGTGNYATDSYGSTGWQLATITVPITGDYILGFASFNLGDTALSPILLVDDLQGTTTLNGQTFGPIAPNAGSNAPVTGGGGSTPPPCPNSSTCSQTPFGANTGFDNRATVWSQQTGNKVVIEQVGNFNAATVVQSGNKNYSEIDLTGSNNTTTINQTTTGVTASNYIEALITGNSNNVNLTQTGSSGNRGIMATVNNSANNLTVNQSGTGNHYAEVLLSGGNKTADVTQSGGVGHMVKIELTGGATSITTTQSGSTQQFYSITHSCAQASCAAITVTQGQ